jgi:Predicted permeases
LQNLKVVGYGLLAGLLSGLLGVGGGIILVPIMVSLLGFAQHNAHATSLAVIIPTAIAGSSIYSTHGNLDIILALTLTAGSIVGAVFGARWMQRIPAAQLKRMFGVLLVTVGVRMLWS